MHLEEIESARIRKRESERKKGLYSIEHSPEVASQIAAKKAKGWEDLRSERT